jgi:biopolymer transport protein ExbB/TolQ
MSRAQSSGRSDSAVSRERRSSTLLAAFGLGLPLAGAVLGMITCGPLHENETVQRYVSHPVEYAEVVMFCLALGVLASKLLRCWGERAGFAAELLPAWDGKTVPVESAGQLLVSLDQKPRRLRNTFLGCRIGNVLDFLRSRGSASDLDDQLRGLADSDALTLEGSYSFTRFIAWAIPILGFLGTVLGITGAISGVTPERLEKDLSAVTDGLALAFDCTALALGLTMVIMFLSFLVERAEQSILERVDRFADRELAHRFERTGAEGGEFIEVVRQHTHVLVKATEQLVQRQAEVWARTLEEVDRRRAEVEKRQQERTTAALETALERTLEAHGQRLATLEKQGTERGADLLKQLSVLATSLRDAGREQQTGLAQIAKGMGEHTDALSQLLEGEQQLLRLQDTLNQNLKSLATAGGFDQTVHSLTAAIHLLTAYLPPSPEVKTLSVRRPGAAA